MILSQQIEAVLYDILKIIKNEYKINHTCETGASGQPILNISENTVIGIYEKYFLFLLINIKLQSDNKSNQNYTQTEIKHNEKKLISLI